MDATVMVITITEVTTEGASEGFNNNRGISRGFNNNRGNSGGFNKGASFNNFGSGIGEVLDRA